MLFRSSETETSATQRMIPMAWPWTCVHLSNPLLQKKDLHYSDRLGLRGRPVLSENTSAGKVLPLP